jgi:glycosyltransferase involved in cell wall biosynthesis
VSVQKTPLVSVIMNCLNGGDYIKKAIDSVIAQTYKNWELIVWDNNSSDGSSDIINMYNDARIKYFLSLKCTPLSKARNSAIKNSNGDFIAFLDVDDWWLPEKLESQMPLFKDPNVGLVYSNYWIYNGKKTKVSSKNKLPHGMVLDSLLSNYCVGLLTIVIRKSFIDNLARSFNDKYNIIGDFDLVIRLSSKCKFSVINRSLAYYRIHDNNESIVNMDKYIEELSDWVEDNRKTCNYLDGKEFYKQDRILSYLKGVDSVNNKRVKLSLFYFLLLPWCVEKIKLLFVIVIPKKIVNMFKL